MPGGGPLLRRNWEPPRRLPYFVEPPQQQPCNLLIDQATQVVRDYYTLGNVQKVAQLYGGYTNLSFSVTMLKNGHSKKYLLRLYRPETSIDHIYFEHALIDHIVASGSQMIARLIRTNEGENFVQLKSPETQGAKDLHYAMFEFIGGEDKYSWTSNRLSDEEYIYSGRILAELHCSTAGFDPGSLPSPHQPILKILSRFPADLQRCAKLAEDSCFDKYFLDNLADILRISKQTSEQLAEALDLPVIAIHGDFHPGNQKYNLNRVIGVFDFDRACLDLRMFDVALAVIYFCSCWEDPMDGKLWLQKAALFLQSYQERAERSSKPGLLLPSEIRLFRPMLTAASLSLIKWASVDTYYLETGNCPDEEYLFYLKHHVRLLRWLETNHGRVEDMLQEALLPSRG